MLKRGEGSEEKPIRSEAHGKENSVLKSYLKKYQNVDENIVSTKHKVCPYQLVHEGGQFRVENPTVSAKKLRTGMSQCFSWFLSPHYGYHFECLGREPSAINGANISLEAGLGQNRAHRKGDA